MSKKKIIFTVLTSVMALICFMLFATKLYYGVWNPLSLPKKINIFGRLYYSDYKVKQFEDNKKPIYPVNSRLSIGKNLYMMHPLGEYVPTVLYLDLGNGKYLVYELSGGP